MRMRKLAKKTIEFWSLVDKYDYFPSLCSSGSRNYRFRMRNPYPKNDHFTPPAETPIEAMLLALKWIKKERNITKGNNVKWIY